MSARRTSATHSVLYGPRGVVCHRLTIAADPSSRLRGLLGRDQLEPDEGLLLERTRRVHTFGMRFLIDAVFCDRELVVVGVRTLAPNRISRRFPGTRHCLEVAAGGAAVHGLEPGARLRIGDQA